MSFLFAYLLGSFAQAEEIKHVGKDGAQLESPISFAAAGNFCTGSLISSEYCGVSLGVFQDIGASSSTGVILMGDFIKSVKPKIWAKQLTTLIAELKKPIVAIPGDSEYSQPKLEQFGSTFGESKMEIGFNRTAGWQHFRITDGAEKWTFLIMDSHKKKMGAKWREQHIWLEGILEGNKDQIVVFLDNPPIALTKHTDAASQEIIDSIYASTGLSQVRLVVFSGSNHTQAFLPDTTFDALYLGCGGGGAKAKNLPLSRGESIQLHPALQAYYIQTLDSVGVDEKTVQQALATGDFAGKPAVLSAKGFPTYGWCSISLDQGLSVEQRHTIDGESFKKALSLRYSKVNGWSVPKPRPTNQENQQRP
jgi:hypothetical protein